MRSEGGRRRRGTERGRKVGGNCVLVKGRRKRKESGKEEQKEESVWMRRKRGIDRRLGFVNW